MKKGIILGVSAFLLVCGLTGCMSLLFGPDREAQRREAEEREVEERKAEEERSHWVIVESKSMSFAGEYPWSSTFAMANWENVFSDKEDAQKWFDDIGERVSVILDIVYARKKLYEDHRRTFASYPMRTTRDALLQNKNNVIEACNRLKPINADIADILAKGVSFRRQIVAYDPRRGDTIDWRISSPPGLEDSKITKAIEDLEKEYARLIDTYPVN
ncbi:hypothetical protein AGMMS49546_14710 [Spirochaetia bacterium]|nr:hypothetical protein AGMMS49546_14710 [Spirochaetia bacterium]